MDMLWNNIHLSPHECQYNASESLKYWLKPSMPFWTTSTIKKVVRWCLPPLSAHKINYLQKKRLTYLWLKASMETSQCGKDISNCNTVLKDTSAKQGYTKIKWICNLIHTAFTLRPYFSVTEEKLFALLNLVRTCIGLSLLVVLILAIFDIAKCNGHP